MEFRGWPNPDFHYSVPIVPENGYYQMSYEDCLESYPHGHGRECEPRHDPLPVMQRYLDETDRAFFTSYAPDADGCFASTWAGDHVQPINYHGGHDAAYAQHPRVASPGSNSISGSSSYVSSNVGEPPETSWASPEITLIDCPPPTVYGYGYSVGTKPDDSQPRGFGSCVALHEVQTHADEQPDETVGFDDEGITYTRYMGYPDIEEGYQPLDSNSAHSVHDRRAFERVDSVYQSPPETIDSGTNSLPATPPALTSPRYRDPSASPNLRRRRRTAAMPAPTTTTSGRVTKRRGAPNRYVDEPAPSRAFPCSLAAYGCTSTFGSKNEWKRHINTQHMRLDFWRCDQCPASRATPSSTSPTSAAGAEPIKKFNDFNRKDLFIQHVRRMHPASIAVPATANLATSPSITTKSPKKSSGSTRISTSAAAAAASQQQAQAARAQDAALMAIAARCRHHTRSPPPESGCLFCPVRFRGEDTWDERLEHIGRHFECMRRGGGGGGEDGRKGGSENNHSHTKAHGTKTTGATTGRGRDGDGQGFEGDMDANNASTDPRRWRRDSCVEDWMIEEGIVVRGGKGRGLVLAT